MMATTQVQIYPPPSTSSRSASPFHVPLSLSLPFPLSFSPCWSRDFLLTLRLDTGSLRRHDTSAFADPTGLSGCAFSTRPQLSHSTLRRFIQRGCHHTYTSIRLSIYQTGIRVCFAVNPLTTHFARCKTMMNTDDRTWDLAPRYDIKPSQLFAVYH